MTVENPTNKTAPANGDGIVVAFPYTNIKLINSTATAANDLLVYIIDNTGALVLQTIVTDYSQTYDDATEAGTITFVTPPDADQQVFAIRERVQTQPFDVPINADFDAEKQETMVDNMSIQISDSQEKIDRSLKLPETFTGVFEATELPVDDELLVYSGTAGEMLNSGVTLTTLNAGATNAAASAVAAASSASAASTSEGNAATSETNAAASAVNAADSAAGVNLPSITGGDATKRLEVNSAEDGYVLVENKIEAVSALFSTNQTIVSSSEVLEFKGDSTGAIDPDSYFDNTNFRFKPTVASTWLITVEPSASVTTAANGSVLLRKNGGVITGGNISFFPAVINKVLPLGTATSIVSFNGSTDYVDVLASVSGLGTSTWGSSQNRFIAMRLS